MEEWVQGCFWIQLGISVLTIAAIPLWEIVSGNTQYNKDESLATGFFELVKESKVRRACLVFLGSCAIEYTCGVWGSTFLVNGKGMEVDTAARVITLYYVGLACGRFLSGIFANKFNSWQLLTVGQGVVLAAIALLLLPFPASVSGVALFMIGLGNAPVFPNMLHLTPDNFGKENSQAVMSIQMSASYLSIMLAPVIFGLIAQYISVALFPVYLCIMFIVMISGTVLMKRSPS